MYVLYDVQKFPRVKKTAARREMNDLTRDSDFARPLGRPVQDGLLCLVHQVQMGVGALGESRPVSRQRSKVRVKKDEGNINTWLIHKLMMLNG